MPIRRERFLIELKDAAPSDDAPVSIRLKRALKSLLRSFSLRCTRAEVHHDLPPAPLVDALGKGEPLPDDVEF